MNAELQIIPYEKWMKPEIVEMFNQQYNYKEGEFDNLFDNFYEADFQKEKCIRLVALDDKKVVGFQTFFYWPYTFNNKIYNVFQSGNSIVHSDYRGKGIFGKLLKYIDGHKRELNIDFLIGFPVEQSYNSFIRKGWNNPFNLIWKVKTLNPLSLILPFRPKVLSDQLNGEPFDFDQSPTVVSLKDSEEFTHYRNQFAVGDYFNHKYSSGDDFVHFQLKVNIRKTVIKELIIGQIHFSSDNPQLINEAFKDLIRRTNKSKTISIISFAYPDNCKIYDIALNDNGFKDINKKIYFITEGTPQEIEEQINKGLFLAHRADIDTW